MWEITEDSYKSNGIWSQLYFLSPFLRVDSDGTRFVQSLGDHHVAEGAIQSGHLDHIKALVCPVNVSCRGQRKSNGALTDPEYVF